MELINHLQNDIFALFGAGIVALSAIFLACGLLNTKKTKRKREKTRVSIADEFRLVGEPLGDDEG